MKTIGYKVSYEKLISRLPALFAFLEIDNNGCCEIVKATRGKQGCYGKIIADVKYESGDFVYECVKDKRNVKISNGIHSYRTLIDAYYKVINDRRWYRDNNYNVYDKKEDVGKVKRSIPFLSFIERGIGLKYVGLSEEIDGIRCGVETTRKFSLAPDYIYLGEAKSLYNKIIKLKKLLMFYEKHSKGHSFDIKNYQSVKDEFENWNGEKLLKVLEVMIDEADDIASEYLTYATNVPNLNFKVNLTTTIKDLGMATPYIQEWVGGKRYYDGDVVYYVDENGYGMTWICHLYKDTNKTLIKDGAKVDDMYRAYTDGYFDKETETIYFEDGNDISYLGLSIKIPKLWDAQYLNWVKKNEGDNDGKYFYKYAITDDEWYKKKNLKTTRQEDTKVIQGSVNSHLSSFRRFETYTNKDDSIEIPSNLKDWLWYYRKNHIINREEKYDELGNLTVMYDINNDGYSDGIEAITDYGSNIKFVGNAALNLATWGDVLTNITAKNNDKTNIGEITFEYVIGAHLIAKKDVRDKLVWFSADDDGNVKYYFKDFEIDNITQYGKKCGVKYVETYIYYKGDGGDDTIWKLVEDGNFESYISGKYDKSYKPENGDSSYYKLYEKMEFDMSNNNHTYDFKVGSRSIKVPYQKSKFETIVDIKHVDFENTPLIRYDYYNGVNFQPKVNDDVNIERGVTQAFEKHIKFSEIKTLEDMENFANGGFFTISKEDIDLG